VILFRMMWGLRSWYDALPSALAATIAAFFGTVFVLIGESLARLGTHYTTAWWVSLLIYAGVWLPEYYRHRAAKHREVSG
jgi:hypothetical protein